MNLIDNTLNKILVSMVLLVGLGISQAHANPPVTDVSTEKGFLKNLMGELERATNGNSARHYAYNMCLFQMKWETSWSKQSKVNQLGYNEHLAPYLDKLVEGTPYNRHQTCLGYITAEELKRIADAYGVKALERTKTSEEILINHPDGYKSDVEYRRYIFERI